MTRRDGRGDGGGLGLEFGAYLNFEGLRGGRETWRRHPVLRAREEGGAVIKDEFAIREARQEDAAALRRLIEESARGLQANDYSAAQIEGALGHALGLDTQLIEDGTYFVAEARGLGSDSKTSELAGCGGWSKRKTLFGSDHGPHREAGLLDPATDAAKIRAIFVHPAWARRGLGSLILRHCEQAARAAGFMELEMGSTLTGCRCIRCGDIARRSAWMFRCRTVRYWRS